jgi:hypothetical protein
MAMGNARPVARIGKSRERIELLIGYLKVKFQKER